MIIDEPMNFAAAIGSLGKRETLPTNLGSGELRLIDSSIRRQSLFSARTMMSDYLEDIRGAVQSILEPAQGVSKDRVTSANPEGRVTVGLDPAGARVKLKEALGKYGYEPEPSEAGTLKDLSSDARLNLVVKTNVELAQGAGHQVQANDPDVLDAFPAQELVRFESHAKQRDWHDRWRQAAEDSGDDDAARVLDESGRMIARKDSPIWDSLGSSDLFPDALDNNFPPFAFNSGMWVQDVSFAVAEKLGLVTLDNVPEPAELDLANLFATESE
jgi:hypothetical protein